MNEFEFKIYENGRFHLQKWRCHLRKTSPMSSEDDIGDGAAKSNTSSQFS